MRSSLTTLVLLFCCFMCFSQVKVSLYEVEGCNPPKFIFEPFKIGVAEDRLKKIRLKMYLPEPSPFIVVPKEPPALLSTRFGTSISITNFSEIDWRRLFYSAVENAVVIYTAETLGLMLLEN